jgi:uncharacterized protein YegJ (DUF2314 family)
MPVKMRLSRNRSYNHPMAPADQNLISIALLLRQPRHIDLHNVERAARNAFREAPQPPEVAPLENIPGFGILLGPVKLGIISLDRPYFRDVKQIAAQIKSSATRSAVEQHRAWLSVDLIGEAPQFADQLRLYGALGLLIAEFLDDNVLAIVRLPDGPILAYDFSFIPMFRAGGAAEVFRRGQAKGNIKADSEKGDAQTAVAEARRRWPEFVHAFAHRRPDQQFAIKKRFDDGKIAEHMWATVSAISGSTVYGQLNNKPNRIKSLKFGDKVTFPESEVEDWIYTDGPNKIGEFHAKVAQTQK